MNARLQGDAPASVATGVAGNLLARADVARAFAFIDCALDSFTADQIAISEIEAPPFAEGNRAAWYARKLDSLGLDNVRIDGIGNVHAVRPGEADGPVIVLSAHLDTVFPAGTDCRVRRVDSRLYGPGIADDAAGLVALLATARALDAGGIRTRAAIHFVATVGEEGDGDLRGCRYLFSSRAFADKVAAFVSFDGPGVERVTHRALGSRRFAVTLTGPGGHSWGDFGIVNPVHALSRAVARLSTYPAPLEPRTSFNVGVISGGTSVNAIPESASLRVDLRSESNSELDRLHDFFRDAVFEAAAEENRIAAASGTQLDVQIETTGDRPSGETPAGSPIVAVVTDASRALGIRPELECSSTDSNVPISLGVPAVTIGGGGSGGATHTLEEWYDPTDRGVGIKRALLVAVALAGLASDA